MLSRKLALILAGQFEQAGVERPQLYVGDRVTIARRALANACFEFGDDPRVLAVRLGMTVAPGRPRGCGRESVGDGVLQYRADLDRRERGLVIGHGIAHELLARDRWNHSHGDVWMLTGDLLVPLPAARLYDASEIVRCAHAPEDFTRRWLALAARFGRRMAAEEAA